MRNGYSGGDERANEMAFSIATTQGIFATSLARVPQDSAFEAQKPKYSGDLEESLRSWVQGTCFMLRNELRLFFQSG